MRFVTWLNILEFKNFTCFELNLLQSSNPAVAAYNMAQANENKPLQRGKRKNPPPAPPAQPAPNTPVTPPSPESSVEVAMKKEVRAQSPVGMDVDGQAVPLRKQPVKKPVNPEIQEARLAHLLHDEDDDISIVGSFKMTKGFSSPKGANSAFAQGSLSQPVADAAIAASGRFERMAVDDEKKTECPKDQLSEKVQRILTEHPEFRVLLDLPEDVVLSFDRLCTIVTYIYLYPDLLVREVLN